MDCAIIGRKCAALTSWRFALLVACLLSVVGVGSERVAWSYPVRRASLWQQVELSDAIAKVVVVETHHQPPEEPWPITGTYSWVPSNGGSEVFVLQVEQVLKGGASLPGRVEVSGGSQASSCPGPFALPLNVPLIVFLSEAEGGFHVVGRQLGWEVWEGRRAGLERQIRKAALWQERGWTGAAAERAFEVEMASDPSMREEALWALAEGHRLALLEPQKHGGGRLSRDELNHLIQLNSTVAGPEVFEIMWRLVGVFPSTSWDRTSVRYVEDLLRQSDSLEAAKWMERVLWRLGEEHPHSLVMTAWDPDAESFDLEKLRTLWGGSCANAKSARCTARGRGRVVAWR